MTTANAFWPGGARLAFSITLQFEAGGQPISGAPGPISEPILPGFPDLGQNSFYEYGAREGVPRLLDLFDEHDIKVSTYMVGEAVRRHPGLAAEVVRCKSWGSAITSPLVASTTCRPTSPSCRPSTASRSRPSPTRCT